MPHLVIETSQDLLLPNAHDLLKQLHQALFATGQIRQPSDLKSRYKPSEVSLVGDGSVPEQFISVQLYLMAGRDEATVRMLCQTIAQTISQWFDRQRQATQSSPMPVQICVNPIELGAQYLNISHQV